MTLAPIVLFVYNRPWHTQQTIEALQKNELANESELFIYSDAPKNESAKGSVTEVRELIKNIKGFKQVTVIERKKNWGLADSIIDGVTTIIHQYGKIIVLEDDLVTSPYFLKYMNEALDFYKDEEKVWHISGWNYPIAVDGLGDVFFWRLMNCWGWATWENNWQFFEKNTFKLINEFSKEQIRYLNLDGFNDAWSQVTLNNENRIKTWAIYWYATIVKNDGLCLNPVKTFVNNIGLDGSGVHCGDSDFFKTEIKELRKNVNYTTIFVEDKQVVNRIKLHYKHVDNNFLYRMLKRIYKIFKRGLNVK
ncbi:MAG: glycosyltransferase [Methylomarinum sp.]|nr:glycosyltransferase [Methylomarinum sp.]